MSLARTCVGTHTHTQHNTTQQGCTHSADVAHHTHLASENHLRIYCLIGTLNTNTPQCQQSAGVDIMVLEVLASVQQNRLHSLV